jgi:putative hydrolase of the HAD superfamily
VNLPSPQLILFDAVHTLIEPDPPVVAVYQCCGERQGCWLEESDLRARFSGAFQRAALACRQEKNGRTDEAGEYMFWQTVVQTVFEELKPPAVDEAFSELWQHFAEPQHWRVFPDVAPTFAELRRRGFRVGIASNFDNRLLKICSGQPELANVDRIFVSSCVGWVKPAAGFYREIERITQLAPEQIALVGDDYENDVGAPRNLGWQTWWLQRTGPADSTTHLSTLTDLLALV